MMEMSLVKCHLCQPQLRMPPRRIKVLAAKVTALCLALAMMRDL